MDERTIEKVLDFEASPDRVWKAITEPEELSKWFGHETELDLRPGGDGAMTWDNHGRYAVRVEEVDPPRRLVWSWVHEPDVPFDEAVAEMRALVGRLRAGERFTHPSPLFGRFSHEQWLALQLGHCTLHFSFLHPG